MKNNFLLAALALLPFLSSPAFAEPFAPAQNGDAPHSANADNSGPGPGDENGGGWGHHHMPLFVTFSARYYSLNNSGYSGAFTSSGLSAPKSGAVGMDFSVYWETKSLWQIGFGFGGASSGNSNGANNGDYESNFYGLWLGKEFELSEDSTLTIGGLFAYGDTTMQVITTGISGSTDETCFTIEPKVTVAHQIAPWLRLGLSASYLEPLAQSQDIKGNALTTGNISLHSVSGGVELIIGKFGRSK